PAGSGIRGILHDEVQRHGARAGRHENSSGKDGRVHHRAEWRPGWGVLPDFPARRGGRVSARILIVEDEKGARQALSSLLSDEGYQVLAAAEGGSALSMALQEEPDLILLDIRLPDMDGLTVLERLRKGHCDAAVIVMTAYATSNNAIKATQYGAFDYVTKP